MSPESKHVAMHALGVVATASIPAAVIGSLAAAPAMALPVETSKTQAFAPKSVNPQTVKKAEQHIKAHLLSSSVTTLGLPAHRSVSEITVPEGASLWSIAREYDTTVDKLRKLNDIKGDHIVAGQKLKISGDSSGSSSPKKTSSSNTKATYYTVKSGDTLSGIAYKHKLSLDSLLKKNDLSRSSKIFPGDKLLVGGQKSAPQQHKSGSAPKSSGGSSYTVTSGDTLGGIAYKHKLSLAELLKLNPKLSKNSVIHPGDKIRVGAGSSSETKSTGKSTPTKSGNGTYTIQSGDTLSGIAHKFGMSTKDLAAKNNMRVSDTIYVGKTLVVSGQKTGGSNNSKPQAPSKTKTSTYTVKAGDTLGQIANSHGMRLAQLLDLNPHVSVDAPLKIGTKLKLSGSSVAPSGEVKKETRKIGNSFNGRTYPETTVDNANENKNKLDAMDVPSRGQMEAMVRSTAQSMGVDPALALAHAYQESGFNMRAVSPANALGVMQVIPSTGEWISGRIGRQLNLLNPQDNVAAGVATIAYNLDNTDNLDHAIAAYYQGLGGVRKYGMYEDTKHYVASVKAHMKRFR